jgi:hypothetical protein
MLIDLTVALVKLQQRLFLGAKGLDEFDPAEGFLAATQSVVPKRLESHMTPVSTFLPSRHISQPTSGSKTKAMAVKGGLMTSIKTNEPTIKTGAETRSSIPIVTNDWSAATSFTTAR